MTRPPVKIFVTRRLPAEIELRLAALFDVTLNTDDTQLSPEALIAAAREHDVLASTLGDHLDAQFFSAIGDRLKLIANFGAGVDHIDLKTAIARGVTVTNTPSAMAEDAADMAMALILAVPRRLVEGVRALESGKFQGWSPTWMLGHSVRGKKLGIIGLGRVGQAVAHRARAFGMTIHYHSRSRINPHMEQALEATYWDSLDQMLARVDIVSVNCPQTPATYHLLSARRLQLLRPDAFVVNISRSEIVDDAALASLIETGKLGGAGLDVTATNPAMTRRLQALPNVVMLPHMASATRESRIDMGERLLINIKMFIDGHKPPDRIIPEIL